MTEESNRHETHEQKQTMKTMTSWTIQKRYGTWYPRCLINHKILAINHDGCGSRRAHSVAGGDLLQGLAQFGSFGASAAGASILPYEGTFWEAWKGWGKCRYLSMLTISWVVRACRSSETFLFWPLVQRRFSIPVSSSRLETIDIKTLLNRSTWTLHCFVWLVEF